MATRRLAIAAALGTMLLPGGCGGGAPKTAAVERAWVRLPAVPGRPGAGYFTLRGGPEAARLVEVTSPSADRIELHESRMEGRAMTMRRLDGADVAAGGTAVFAPGGDHAMVFGISPGVKAGDRMRLSFRLAKGQPIAAEARVVGAGDAPPW